MATQVEITQKKNGTLLVAARLPVEGSGEERQLRSNPYRDLPSFLHVLGAAELDGQTRATIAQAASEAEQRPEAAVVCEVGELRRAQLDKIGLN